MTRLRATIYGLLRAVKSTARRPLISLLATGAIGVSLLLVGVVGLAAANVQRLTSTWGAGVQMVVYLDDGTSVERARAIAAILSSSGAVERVDYVPPDEAYRRLHESLGDDGALLDGVEVGFLPGSLEVTLRRGTRDVAAASPLVERLRATEGVEDVAFLGDWVDRMTALLRSLRLAAIALAILVAIACVYVVGGTIKLGMYARKDELEVLKLVGATDFFVKAPLVVEGALHGACGAGLAVAMLWGLHRFGAPILERALAAAVGDLRLTFLPASQLGILLAAGAVLGVLGSWLAIGKQADA